LTQRPASSGTAALGRSVGTVGAVDGHAVAAGDEADDVIARNGRAALGELDKAVGKPLHHDAVLALFTHGNGGAGLARLAGDGHGGVALGLLLLVESLELVADAVDGLLRREAAVADGGVQSSRLPKPVFLSSVGRSSSPVTAATEMP